MAQIIYEDNPINIWKSISRDYIGISGYSIELTIKRDDDLYWNNTTWVETKPSGIYMIEDDNINNPGYYLYPTNTEGFLGEKTREGFDVRFYISGVLDISQKYYSLPSSSISSTVDIEKLNRMTRRILKEVK